MNSQDKHFGGLSRKSIHHSLLQMTERAPVAGFVQSVLYPACMGLENLRRDPYMLLGWSMMLLVFLARVILKRSAPRILARKNGITIWRWYFGVSSQVMSLTWSLTCAYAIIEHGITPTTLSMLISCLGTLAIYCASYPMDPLNWGSFMLSLIAPLLVATVFYMPDESYFSFGIVIYSIFAGSMAMSLRRAEIELLRKVEEVERLHRELKVNHELIQTMIASIDELFIIFNLDGRCEMAASERSKELLGLDPMDLHLNQVLRLTGVAAKENREWYESLISGRVDFHLAAGLGPGTLLLEQGQRRLSLQFHGMRDGDGRLTGVVMTGHDTTLEMRQQKELEAARERAELIIGAHENRAVFLQLLQEFENLIGRLNLWNGGSLEELRFDLHTLKGNATLAGALPPGRMIHELERSIQENVERGPEAIREAGAEFTRHYREWLFAEQPTLEKSGLFDDRVIRISLDKMEKLKRKWARKPEAARWYERFEADLSATEFGELFEPFASQVRFAAQAAGKKARLVIQRPTSELYVEPEDFRDVFGTFVHLFTNAVDHGIEMPIERVARGKPAEGTIEVVYRAERDFIVIEVRDDGAGINVSKLRHKLKLQGHASAELASDQEVIAHIFDEGLSTRDRVTALSGMGMGLGALKSGVSRVKGRVEVTSTGPTGTTVTISLPRNNSKSAKSKSA